MEPTSCPLQASRPAGSRQHGFTLIEMLIVIGIMVVLIALLLPALSKARQSVNALRCMSNLRQIGMAEAQYAADHKGMWVPTWVTYGGTDYEWPGLLVIGKYLDCPLTTTGKIDEAGTTDSVFGCPDGFTDSFAPGSPTAGDDAQGARPQEAQLLGVAGTRKYLDFWYASNASTQSPFVAGLYNQFPNWCVPPQNHPTSYADWPRVSRVGCPSQMVDKLDGCNTCNPFNAWRFHARHFNFTMTNILFWDGHVETVPFVSLPQPKSPMGNQIWDVTHLNLTNPSVLFMTSQAP